MSDPKPAVEIRPDDKGGIDEIVAQGCAVHVERMDTGHWYMGIEASDGSCWQFWFGSKNRKTAVEFGHHEMTPAPTVQMPKMQTKDMPFHPPPDDNA